MSDVLAVAWKEWREVLGQRGLRGKSGILLFLAVFGVFLPLQAGPGWVTSPIVALAWSWVPMFLVSTVIADAFAGERERHTLETLLATRLSDEAILFGKMVAAVGYAGAVTAGSLALGELAVNLSHWRTGAVFYQPAALLAMGVIGLLGAVFVAAIGVLLSSRAATVRQAQQALGGTIIALTVLPVGATRLLPAAWKAYVVAHAPTAWLLGIGAVSTLVLLDVGAVALAMLRFRRSCLIVGEVARGTGLN